MSPKKGLTQKDLIQELEKGLTKIEEFASDGTDTEEEVKARQKIRQMIDDVRG